MATNANTSTNLTDRLLACYEEEGPLQIQPGHELPSFDEVRRIIELLRELIFPGYAGDVPASGLALRTTIEAKLGEVKLRLSRELFRGLHHRCSKTESDCSACEGQALLLATQFLDELPLLRERLLADVQAAYEGDPAATGADEVIFAYPGPYAITVYRLAHRLLELGAVIVPRMMTEEAHMATGIDIHPGATIGEGFFIDHGTGVVIGETTVIGKRVRIYQGVTLGALSLPTSKVRSLARQKRHPTIEDEVIIYANATILGGETVIGKGAVIGGNTFVMKSVEPGARHHG